MKYSKSSYSKKLLDPRWQRKRLDILNRDSFTCQECQSTENTLHVHHRYYEANLEPWEYPNEALLTLCYDCHEFETENHYEAEKDLILTLKKLGFLTSDIALLTSCIKGTRPEITANLKKIIVDVLIDEQLSYVVAENWYSIQEKFHDAL